MTTMLTRLALFTLCLLPICGAATELNFAGATGALTTPGTQVISEGDFEFQANTDKRLAGARSNAGEARTYLLGIGLLPHIELTGRLAVPDITIPGGYADLSANIKASVYQSQHFGLAAGVLDLAGDSQLSTSKYVVGSATYETVTATVGYGNGQLDGVFGSLSYTPAAFISLLGDYDGRFYSAGARLQHRFGNTLKVSFTTKLYSDSFQKTSYGLSVSRSLDFHEGGGLLPDSFYEKADALFGSNWFANDHDGLRNISQRPIAGGEAIIVRAENAAYRQRQADSDTAACKQIAADGVAHKVVYDQYRYGLPIVSTALDCTKGKGLDGTTTWLTEWQEKDQIAADFLNPSAYGVEVRLAPDLRSFAATEVGIFDYSLALYSSARLQLPAGLGAYVTYESPLSKTDNFDDPELFQFYKHRRGVREKQLQWAHHLLPGLFGLHSIGRSTINALEYNSQRNDFIYNIGRGTNQIYGTYATYKTFGNSVVPDSKVELLGYRLFLPQYASSIEIDKGKFFYGDKGFRVRANRHFGDTIVTLFLKRSDSENQVAGLELSFPLTPRRGLSAGPVTVVGDPRFRFSRGTSFGQSDGRNSLKPLLMVEPEADYNLRTDWLDSDRLFPAFPGSRR